MPSLISTLRDDLTTAMKARDELRTATLRMTLAAISTEAVAGKSSRELSDDEVLSVIARESRKRREAATAFRAGDRADRADREEAEGAVLDSYLPVQLSDEELRELVRAAVTEAGVSGPQAIGAVMRLLGPRVGKRADGSRVAAAVRAALSD
ncbi:MAG TPA: GatB/YqeY domain-containing protein [Mycobacteriales bacterium]|nr:GatB/YqeY domain-containing protein [Mycobacteriales bacterium]